MALVMFLMTGSCQREDLGPAAGGNTVSYTVQLPDAIGTKAIGENVSEVTELVYEVYYTEATSADDFSQTENKLFQKKANLNNGVATINFELVNNQNFRVLFWAQVPGNGVYNTDDLKNVTLSQSLSANAENYAAFSGTDFIKNGDELIGRTITLRRPVAQLNIATTGESLSIEGQTDVEISTTAVKVNGLSTTYNVAEESAGEVSGACFAYSATDPSGLSETVLSVNGKSYQYVAMNYVGFAEATGSTVKVDYVINTENVGTITNTINNVPVKANYRTNIIGNLITSMSDYTITLENKWNESVTEYEIWDGKTLNEPATNAEGAYVVNKPSEWAYLASIQNPATKALPAHVVVNLTSDLDFGGNEITGLVAARSGSLTINGNGYAVLNATVVSGNNDNGTNAASLFISLPNSELKVENLDVKNVNVVTSGANPYAGVLTSYVEGKVTIKNVNVYNSSVYGVDSIGAIIGFLPANGTVTVENVLVDGVKLANADVADESGAMGGFVGRVAGQLIADNVKVANTIIEAYVGTDSEQKRSVAKFIGNFVGGGMIDVTDASIENVTIVAMNDLAETQQCLYTEFLGGWRGNGGTVSINGIEITKEQTNEDITIDTKEELAAALSNAADGAVIPVSGEIATNALSVANGKNITIVGLSDGATINSSSARMNTTGNITFKNITITLPTNNDYYGGHDASNGNMVFDNCKFVGTAVAINGTFIYNDCEFTNPDKYAAWVYNGNVTYNNCSFTGKDRAAKVYAEAGNAPVVTYNNCTFNALSVNKTAVEIDCTNQTSGTPYYVTIINPTIKNMGVAEHYAVGAEGVCNLETSGVGLGIVTLGDKSYSVAHTTAQLNLLAYAITEDMGVTTIEVAGGTYDGNIDLTVAAAGKTATGSLVFKAAEGASPVMTGTATLGYREQGTGAAMWNCNITFEGITFDHIADATHSINVQDVKSLTLKNCTIIGDGECGIDSARGNDTGVSKIEGCTFVNAPMQILGNFGTGLVIDGCTFNESRINVQAGNGVTVQDCTFNNTLKSAHVGDSFYCVRSNSTPITIKESVINIDSELTEVAADQAKWYLLANRGTTNWTVENVAVTLSDAALMQTELDITACESTGVINTTNLTVNGIIQ